MMNPRKRVAFRTDLCMHVFESPVTGNACHVITFPNDDGHVLVNDLDMGETYKLTLSDVAESQCKRFRPVEVEDFQFSWVVDIYDEDLYNALFGVDLAL